MAPNRDNLPTLKAVILDFSSVNNVDITSVQHLIDVRNQLDRYAAPDKVEWHLACINNRWTKRALASAGFGYPAPSNSSAVFKRWKAVFSVAEMGGFASAAAAAEFRENERQLRRQRTRDLEEAHRPHSHGSDIVKGNGHDNGIGAKSTSVSSDDFGKELDASKARVAIVHGINLPLFHIDLTSALQSAIANAERRGEADPLGSVHETT